MSLTRHNNFDLLRLFAAYQVAFFHALAISKYQTESTAFAVCKAIYSFFPGLPIFFIISGFLVSSSLEKNLGNLRSYFWSRFLRIYPGLWVALLIFLIIGASGYCTLTKLSPSECLLWFFAQFTFFQNWIPSFLRTSVAGGFYGALWTIPVELAFYMLLPILYIFVIKKLMSRWAQNTCLIAIGLLSFWANVYYNQLVVFLGRVAPLPPKILFFTFVPHLWLFILGLLAWRNFDRIRILVERRFILWSALFIGLNYGLQYLYKMMGHAPDMLYNYLDMVYPAHWLYNASYALVRVVLAMWVLSAAFSVPHVAEKVLRGQDISYGVYLYHSLLISLMVSYNFFGSGLSLLTALLGAGILGFISWTTVEKRFLKLKKKGIGLK